MKEELGDHGTRAAQEWFNQRIAAGAIVCYDDGRILEELKNAIGMNCFSYYRSFLKSGCDMIRSDFYSDYFEKLDEWLKNENLQDSSFLSVLSSCETLIGHQKSYGEVKAFVLLKTIHLLYGERVFIFCSDDFGARQGFANTALIPCISILSVFLKLWLLGKSFAEVQPYYQSFVDWCMNRENPQISVKVWTVKAGSLKREKVSIINVLEDIYAGRYEARKDGDLLLK